LRRNGRGQVATAALGLQHLATACYAVRRALLDSPGNMRQHSSALCCLSVCLPACLSVCRTQHMMD
jgi:hypothetical protein